MSNLYDELLRAGGYVPPSDPYAALARLPASFVRQAPAQNTRPGLDRGVAGTPGALIADGDYLLSTPGLTGFESKYNSATRNPDGSFSVSLQKPGGGKYDLLEAIYRSDPATGELVLQGQPREFKMESSASQNLKGLAAVAGMAAGGYLLGGATGAGATAAGTAAGGVAPGAGAIAPLSSAPLATASLSPALTSMTLPTLGGAAAGGTTLAGLGAASAAGAAGAGGAATAAGSATVAGTQAASLYGAGMTGAQTSAFGTVAGLTGSNTLAALAAGTYGGASSILGGIGSFLSSGSGVRSIFDIVSGLYGLKLARDARDASDPFAPYRGAYAQQLSELEANPNLITSRPGYKAGIEAVTRNNAARGYAGSGNETAVLSRYGGEFFNNELNRLATLAGAGQAPGAGMFPAANLTGQSLASIGYGLAPFIGGPR